MKKYLLVALVFTLMLSSCDVQIEESADKQQQKQSEKVLKEGNSQIGMPAMINFQEKKNLKRIYELCDQEKLICHAYLFNSLKGEVGQYLGKCYGYGIPYSTQFSNPVKTVDRWASNGFVEQLPQAEPNGLFKPEGLSATWLIMVDPKTNKPRPVYVEPEIIVSPFKLK